MTKPVEVIELIGVHGGGVKGPHPAQGNICFLEDAVVLAQERKEARRSQE